MDPTITPAETPGDLAEVAEMLVEYAELLGSPEVLAEARYEAAGLPGIYAPPRGALLLARPAQGGPAQGCIALRPLPGPGDSEVKRLFVRGPARGTALGQRMGDAVIALARDLGYRRVVMEAQLRMTSALRIYEALGFRPIPPYYPNPAPGTVFLALDLAPEGG